MDALRYFSKNVDEATEAFCEAARERFAVRREFGRRGVFQDVVEIGQPHARKCLVVLGGVHGVEGFAASAVQSSLVREPLPLAADTRVVLVHGVNAYGMRARRRVNANNVDLNRNARPRFDTPGELSPAAAYVHATLDRYQAGAPHVLAARIAFGLFRHGYRSLGSAIAGGQTAFPTSMFFAGTSVQPELELLLEILSGLASGSDRLRVIDLHSGIGRRPHIQFHGSPARYPQARKVFGATLKRGHGATLFAVTGSILDYVWRKNPGKDLDLLTFESGTVGSYGLLHALQRENFFHHADPGGADDRAAKEALLEMFVPDDPGWRKEYVAAARAVCRLCLDAT